MISNSNMPMDAMIKDIIPKPFITNDATRIMSLPKEKEQAITGNGKLRLEEIKPHVPVSRESLLMAGKGSLPEVSKISKRYASPRMRYTFL